MSKYTTELRYICETYAGEVESQGGNDVDAIIETARPLIFNFTYPLHDATHKAELETKIIKHYYFREIGFETVGLWKMFLARKMNEIMPYYNQLYASLDLTFNPLHNVDYTITHEGTESGENTESTDATNQYTEDALGKRSDTPQGTVTNLLNDTYLSEATSNHTTGSGTTGTDKEGEYSKENEYTQRITGAMGGTNYNRMLKEYRENMLNIDMQIIRELGDLFMLIW